MQELRLAWRAYACRFGTAKVYVGGAPKAQVAFAARALSPDEPWPVVGSARIADQTGPLHLVRWPASAPLLAIPVHEEPPAPGSPIPVMLSLSFTGPAADLYPSQYNTSSIRSVADTAFVLLAGAAVASENPLTAVLRTLPDAQDLLALANAITGFGSVEASGAAAQSGKSGYPQ